MPELSVILCTHNPRRDYLERTVEALNRQELSPQHWELVVIDNASEEPVASVLDLGWHPTGRVLREEKLGLTCARLLGIAEAKSDLLVFVDDDNVLSSDYLARAYEIARSHPFLGAWGGSIEGEFEQTPPAWIQGYLSFLALRPVPRDLWSNSSEGISTLPFGAGMCVRANVARSYGGTLPANALRQKLDRRGRDLSSAGDLDLALTAYDIGLGTGLFSRLRLKHLIPAERLTLDYMTRLSEAASRSDVILRFARFGQLGTSNYSRGERLLHRYRELRATREVREMSRAWSRGQKHALAQLREQGLIN